MKSLERVFVAAVLVLACTPHEASAWPWSNRPKPAAKGQLDGDDADKRKGDLKDVPVQSIEETLYVPPKAEKITLPVYPYEMLKQRVSGEASVACMVDVDGKVIRVEVMNATRPEFAEALTAALEATHFAYATREGEPIMSVLGIKHRFEPPGKEDQNREDLSLLERSIRQPHSLGKARQLDRPLRAKKQPPPAFPTRLLRKGSQGTALIEFLLDEYGEARLPRVLSASDPAFGYAAAHAVAQWRFEPPTAGGEPCVMRVTVPFVFNLQ